MSLAPLLYERISSLAPPFSASRRTSWLKSPEVVSFLAVAAMAAAAFAGNAFVGFRFRGGDFGLVWPASLLIPAVLACLVFRAAAPIAEGLYYFSLQYAMAHCAIRATYVGMHAGFPWRDAEYAAADAVIGFDWNAWRMFLYAHPRLLEFLEKAYNTHIPQLCVAVLLLPFVLPRLGNARLLLSLTIAAAITATIGSLWPALGPADAQGMVAPMTPTVLKVRGLVTDEALPYVGGVNFPSFHTAMAILMTLAYLGRPRIMAVCILINVALLCGVPFSGDHYLVDIFGGAAVAAVSFALAQRCLVRLDCEPEGSPFRRLRLARYAASPSVSPAPATA